MIPDIILEGKRDGRLHVYYCKPCEQCKIDEEECARANHRNLCHFIEELLPKRKTIGRLITSPKVNPVMKVYHGDASMILFTLSKLLTLQINGFIKNRLMNVRYFAVVEDEFDIKVARRFADHVDYQEIPCLIHDPIPK